MTNVEIDTSIGEYKIPGEDEIIQRYVEIFSQHFSTHYVRNQVHARRAIHAKSHGCLRASFEVLDHGDPDLNHGVFKRPAIFDAIVRISNGDGPPGSDTDKIVSVGFAVKILGVLAEKYLSLQRENTQDFLFLNQPAYISSGLRIADAGD